jgi:hypothetical protein
MLTYLLIMASALWVPLWLLYAALETPDPLTAVASGLGPPFAGWVLLRFLNDWRDSTRRRKGLLGVALLTILIIRPALCEEDSGNWLYSMCTRESAVDQMGCISYLMGFFVGVQDEAFAANEDHPVKICTPGAVSAAQARLIFLRRARTHPGDLSWPAGIAVRQAFQDAFPCPVGKMRSSP